MTLTEIKYINGVMSVKMFYIDGNTLPEKCSYCNFIMLIK